MWRRMQNKDYYEYHLNSNAEESTPFLPINAGSMNCGIRTNISAARQFNESPSFHRMAASSNTNSLGRNRLTSTNNRQNYSSTMSSNHNNRHRINDFMLKTDPYTMLNPSAPLGGNY